MPGFDTNFLSSSGAPAGAFATTHWSMVLRAGDRCGPESAPALEKLCRGYWYPLYAYVRREGHAVHEAQDLTQAFFARLLGDNSLASVHPDKGRFRSFLIASLKHFLINEWKHSQRQKRGGGKVHFHLDEEVAQGRYRLEPAENFTPEKAFERRWAETLLQRVLDHLKAEWGQRDASVPFDEMKPFLLEGKGSVRIADVAARLGVTGDSLKWSVRKLRQRYREIFREEIAHTVGSPEDIDDEIRHLFSVLTD
jgi:DNA-directed RNA polymerase specialized sigma24 family protein